LQQFAYVASHDLQEPLRMITSYLTLLENRYKDKLDDDADEFIEFAVDGAKRMKQLIKDLLQFSRVGTHGKSFQKTNCEAVLKKTLSNLEVAIIENQAEITYDSLPMIKADDSQLLQLFQNLISNAIKFRSEKPPKIHVGAISKNGEWVFSVNDNGIGIEEEYEKRIFVIFQRLHANNKYPGTGIGLALCRKIVERHGGHIWFKSKLGEGSTFYFTIPKNKGNL
jgi:light-regulated signal transduction histidine kinase (bacteriophytochrome)